MRYQGIHPGLDIALKYVNDEFLSTLGRERVSIKGDDVYAFKVDLRTKSETETFFENHHEYIDIHVVLEWILRFRINLNCMKNIRKQMLTFFMDKEDNR